MIGAQEMIIELEIVEARGLLASDRNGFSDPYVVVEKTPGLRAGAKTPIIKKTLDPVWNFKTVLHFTSDLEKLKFRVFDWDRFSSDDPLGSCSFSPSIFNDGVPIDTWEPLKQKPKKKKKCLLFFPLPSPPIPRAHSHPTAHPAQWPQEKRNRCTQSRASCTSR